MGLKSLPANAVDSTTSSYREAGPLERSCTPFWARLSNFKPHVPRADPQLADRFHVIATDLPGLAIGMPERTSSDTRRPTSAGAMTAHPEVIRT